MGDFINRLRGIPPSKKEVSKQEELSAIRRMSMSFCALVREMLKRNISAQDPDLLARASMVPWMFPDLSQLQSDKHICILNRNTRSEMYRRCCPETIKV